jgi:hypothetical protein
MTQIDLQPKWTALMDLYDSTNPKIPSHIGDASGRNNRHPFYEWLEDMCGCIIDEVSITCTNVTVIDEKKFLIMQLKCG